MDCFNKECAWLSGKNCSKPWHYYLLRQSDCSSRLSHPSKKVKIDTPKILKKESVDVSYWYKNWSSLTGYENGSKYSYSELHNMIDHVLECGLKVMLIPHENGVTLAIDDKTFNQR